MKKVLLSTCLICLCCLPALAQDTVDISVSIDSALQQESKIKDTDDLVAFYLFLAGLYQKEGQLENAQEVLQKAYRETAKLEQNELTADILEKLGDLALENEKHKDAIDYYRRGLILVKDSQNSKRIADFHTAIGNVYTRQYNFTDALDEYNKALMIQTTKGLETEMAQSYTTLGNIFRNNLGKASEAILYYERALDIYKSEGDSANYAWTLNRIGNCRIDLGDYKQAYDLYNRALIIHEKQNNQIGVVAAYNNMGEVFRYQGNYTGALENYLKGLKISRDTKDDRSISILYNNVGIIYYEQGVTQVALDYFRRSLKYGDNIRFKEGAVETYNYMGLTFKKRGEFESAKEYYDKSMAISEELGDRQGQAFSLNAIGDLYLEQEQYSSAIKSYQDAYEIANMTLDKNAKVSSLMGMAKVRIALHNEAGAIATLRDAIEIAKDIGIKPQISEIYRLKSKAYEQLHSYHNSLEFYKRHTLLNDSLQNSKVTQQIEVMQQKFTAEQREREMELLKKERELQAAAIEKNEAIIKEQSLKQAVTAVGLVLFLIAAILGWYGYNERKRAFDTLALQKRQIEDKNKDITASIQYAKRIQNALLTSNDYLKNVMPQHFVYYQPKDIVSGDFYWGYLTNDENKAIVAVVDCTGHGVPGAFMSMIGMSLLNEIVMEHRLHHPDEILNELRADVIEALKQRGGQEASDGMDVSLIAWDKKSNNLEFSGANNPVYVIRNKEFFELKGDKQPIGLYAGNTQPFTRKDFQLEPGDMVYLFSDGYADQFGEENNKKFKYHNFKDLLVGISDKGLDDQKSELHDTYVEWKGSFEQLDDICIVGLRV